MHLDVAIVGAGLAGLAAAHALDGYRVRIFEREPTIGGRVLSMRVGELRVDVGACFAYSPELLPAGAASPGLLHRERGAIGIGHRGELVSAASAWETVEKLSISEATRTALAQARTRQERVDTLPSEAADITRALFHQIHPADMAQYSAPRQADAWHDWYPDHWSTGNGSLVDAYAAPLRQAFELDAQVVRCSEHAAGVRLHYQRNGSLEEVDARALIIATPATAARSLVTPDDAECASFLEHVRYGRYTVVAFVGPATDAAAFRCVVAAQGPLKVVMQHDHPDQGQRVLLCYYDDLESVHADTLDDRALVRHTAEQLQALGIASIALEQSEAFVKRWPLSGTILSDEYARRKQASFARASKRIFLAGDYLATTPGWGYGMDDAVSSGRATGARLRALLDSELA